MNEANSSDLEQIGLVGDLFNIRLRRVDNHIARATRHVWGSKNFRRGTIAALSFIVEHPDTSQKAIAQALDYDKSGVNSIINGLEELGWAKRRKSGTDKRSYHIHATPLGEAELRRIVEEVRAIEVRLFSGMSATAKAELVVLLDQLHNSCLDALFENEVSSRK